MEEARERENEGGRKRGMEERRRGRDRKIEGRREGELKRGKETEK